MRALPEAAACRRRASAICSIRNRICSTPRRVLREVAARPSPGAYLASLHPKHDQFERLRQELGKAVAAAKARGSNPSADGLVQRIVVNMERWRWMPLELGAYHVWNNVPAFTTRVMKHGKSI